ncbi:hypothetical protein [Aurantiacibacter odishensis]|uniref:hypothetical protein n=1 Tax=Aurantiacibacter odishensis TaxID=1155476 RepID=UPI000E7330A1|nr:hypothetical protein [Aurantiacibacter odishensis]
MDTDESENELPVPAGLSAYYAATELHMGRLRWFAEHLRATGGRIHPLVCQTILELMEGGHPYYTLEVVRRSDLPTATKNSQLELFRDADMALAVARIGGFRRGPHKDACHKVGKAMGLSSKYVRKRVAPHREMALKAIEQERLQEMYDRGEVDYLGRKFAAKTLCDEEKS